MPFSDPFCTRAIADRTIAAQEALCKRFAIFTQSDRETPTNAYFWRQWKEFEAQGKTTSAAAAIAAATPMPGPTTCAAPINIDDYSLMSKFEPAAWFAPHTHQYYNPNEPTPAAKHKERGQCHRQPAKSAHSGDPFGGYAPHLTASFQPSYAMDPTMNPDANAAFRDEYSSQRPSRFRFKSHNESSSRSSAGPRDDASRRSNKRSRDEVGDDDDDEENKSRAKRRTGADPFATKTNPKTAFLESLYDAMADDEGAAYWEGVYGQPVHIYAAHRETINRVTGERERMTDDEFADYVRRRMWERTHANVTAERRRKEREQRARRNERARLERERLEREVDASLRRGRERKRVQDIKRQFDEYMKLWEEWDGEQGSIPWPVQDCRRERLSEKAVREFVAIGLDYETAVAAAADDDNNKTLLAGLKEQRVRWHPDKLEFRLGGRGKVDKDVMDDVTMIFQVVDKLWNDTRKSSQ